MAQSQQRLDSSRNKSRGLCPPKVTEPEFGSKKPVLSSKTVVLPAPEGPNNRSLGGGFYSKVHPRQQFQLTWVEKCTSVIFKSMADAGFNIVTRSRKDSSLTLKSTSKAS